MGQENLARALTVQVVGTRPPWQGQVMRGRILDQSGMESPGCAALGWGGGPV